MAVTYTPAQGGSEQVGIWVDGAGAATVGGVLGTTGGLQFTIPAPNELLFRSLTLTLTPSGGVGGAGVLAIGLVNDINEVVFSATNLPTNQTTIPLYSDTVTFAVGTPVSCALNLGVATPQTGGFVGALETANQVLGHSGFQGNVALVLTFSGVTTVMSATDTLVGDETPFLTGLPSHKPKVSRADWCPRCGQPVFRQDLIEDGYARNQLVCRDCYDPPERFRRRYHTPKEVNP